MTIAAVVLEAGPFSGNGVTTSFPFTFKCFDKSEMIWTYRSVAGLEAVIVLDLDYSVTLNVDQNATPGGSITFPLGGSAYAILAVGEKLVGVSNAPETQLVDLVAAGGWFPEVVENALDRAVLLIQQLSQLLSRTLTYPITDTVVGATLPTSTQRANMFLAFDSSGNPIAATGITGTAVSAAMIPVISAATLALARTALGVDATGTAILKTFVDAKGDLITATADNTPARKAVGADGKVLAADSTQSDGLVWTDFLRPNLLLNPNWLLDQINAGALYTVTGGGAVVQGPDGWTGTALLAPGVFKLRQLADPDNAALKCMEITCTTIDAAIAAGDGYHIHQAIEGYDFAALGWGTAGALPVNITFAFKSNVNGIYGVALRNSALNRSYVATINVVNSNENTYAITVPGDTAGAWLYTNGVGVYLSIALAAGATFQAVAGAWGAGNFLTTAAQANLMSNIANIAYLKRVQLTAGSIVTGFAPADIQRELARASRHYQFLSVSHALGAVGGNVQFTGSWPVPMRAVPTAVGPTGTALTLSATGYTVSVAPGGTAVIAGLNARLS